ncbi:MAG: hypothetical protein ACFFED_00300 [Candidatus Thorarchaeota archaeon]
MTSPQVMIRYGIRKKNSHDSPYTYQAKREIAENTITPDISTI